MSAGPFTVLGCSHGCIPPGSCATCSDDTKLTHAHMMLIEADDKRREAMTIINEVERGRHERRKWAADHQKCSCGHIHSKHTGSHNHNYSAGACRECKCMNFVLVGETSGHAATGNQSVDATMPNAEQGAEPKAKS